MKIKVSEVESLQKSFLEKIGFLRKKRRYYFGIGPENENDFSEDYSEYKIYKFVIDGLVKISILKEATIKSQNKGIISLDELREVIKAKDYNLDNVLAEVANSKDLILVGIDNVEVKIEGSDGLYFSFISENEPVLREFRDVYLSE